MSIFYSFLLSSHGILLGEPRAAFQFFTERHLQALWFEQKYFKELNTSTGQKVRVISPGIWNQQAGPDFLKAHLMIGDREVRGDVELHLSSQDWYHHRHNQDSRYNQVCLHVCLWNPKTQKAIRNEKNEELLQVVLEDSLIYPLAKLMHFIDLDLYPYQTFLGSGKCSRLLFQDLSEKEITELFQSAAAWRLLRKSRALHYRVDNSSLTFLGGLAMTLGYKNNAEAFLQLFLWLYPLRYLGEEALQALAFGVCGIFTAESQAKWATSPAYQRLHALYLMLALTHPISLKLRLNTHQVRPLNHPIRRLVTLIKLLLDQNASDIYSRMEMCWTRAWREKKIWSQLKENLIDCFPYYQDSYWSRHFLFEIEEQKKNLPLMGASVRQEMLINVFLPLLYQEIVTKGDRKEEAQFKEFYHSIRASYSGKSQYLIHRFLGESSKQEILYRADTQQGAFELHRDFCLYYEASCEGCPFIERYKEKSDFLQN